MTALLPLLWAGTSFWGCWRYRPRPSRVEPAPRQRARRALPPVVVRVGAAALASLLALPITPGLAPFAAAGAWAVPVVRARRRRRRAVDGVWRSLPEAVDLVAVAVGAGLTVPLAVAAVARRHDGPIAVELGRVTAEVAAGRRFAEALDAAAVRLGPSCRPLLDALLASERHGAPLGEALARVGADLRAERRRRAEEAVRRVPVKLLFPVVTCILPAFALLTVAPVLAGTYASLRH